MAKRLEINGKILGYLRRAVGEDVNPANYAVFETIALDNEPVNAGGIYYKARHSNAALNSLTQILEVEKSVPLITLHDEVNQLPIGRVFHSEVNTYKSSVDRSPQSELRALFYLPIDNDESLKYAKLIDSGVVTDVSVGILPSSAKCSECDWDYFGEESSFFNFFFAECENEHEIGVDGVHLNIEDISNFNELSLVTNGAVEAATIQSREDSKLTEADIVYMPIAAKQFEGYGVLTASTVKGSEDMKLGKHIKDIREQVLAKAKIAGLSETDTNTLMETLTEKTTLDEVSKIRADLKHKAQELKLAEEKPAEEKPAEEKPAEEKPAEEKPAEELGLNLNNFVELKADLVLEQRNTAALEAKIVEVQKTLTVSDETVKSLEAKLAGFEGSEGELKLAKEHLSEHCRKLLVAAGDTKPEVPESIEGLTKKISETSEALEKQLPIGGVLNQAKQVKQIKSVERNTSVYATRDRDEGAR